MKITPDLDAPVSFESLNETRFPFYESLDEEGYYYEIFILIDGEKARVVITDDGVSVDYFSGNTTHTNIVPRSLFGEVKKLDVFMLNEIMSKLEMTGFEGRSYSEDEMGELYKEYLEKKND